MSEPERPTGAEPRPPETAPSTAQADGNASSVYDELGFDQPRPPEAAPPPNVLDVPQGPPPTAEPPNLARAVGLGVAAALAGSLAYYGVRWLTGYELGLIAIGVGMLVGVGVRMGAGYSTHWGYRALAVGLSYASVAGTYMPAILASANEPHLTFGLLSQAFQIALQIPLLSISKGNLMSTVILAIALYEAYKLSAPNRALPRRTVNPAPRPKG